MPLSKNEFLRMWMLEERAGMGDGEHMIVDEENNIVCHLCRHCGEIDLSKPNALSGLYDWPSFTVCGCKK